MRAVVLDCLGTLLRLEPPAPRLREELIRTGIAVSEERAQAAFASEIAYYLDHHLEGADADGLERLRDGCARVVAGALSLGEEELRAVREAMLAAIRFTPYPDAAPALEALRSAGLALVVASNWDCSLSEVLEGAGLRRLLDAVVTSAEAGAAKPEPVVFGRALDAVGCPPEAAVCIGDSLEHDVEGARAAGLAAAVLLARQPGAHAGAGVPVIGTLEEAPSVIFARE